MASVGARKDSLNSCNFSPQKVTHALYTTIEVMAKVSERKVTGAIHIKEDPMP
jgi:hypothetical protein